MRALPARRTRLRRSRRTLPNCRQKLSLQAVTVRPAWLWRAVPATPAERAAALWSFAYFFMLLAGYYVLRPVRDQMGIAGGVKALSWMFTATFVTLLVAQPLYGALVAKVPRRRFIPIVYHFFVANLALFWLLLTFEIEPVVVARVFFVWVSVFNLFAVTVFWSFMADIFTSAAGQAPVRVHRRRRHRGRAARAVDHHRTLGAARTGQSADRRRGTARSRRLCVYRLERTAGAIRHEVRARRADRRRRVRRVYRSAAFTVSAGDCSLGEPAVVRRDDPLFRAGEPGRDRRAGRRSADARLRERRPRGQRADTRDSGLRNRPAAQALRHGVAAGALPAVYIVGFTVPRAGPTLTVVLVFQVVQRWTNFAIANPARQIFFTVVGAKKNTRRRT